MYTQALDLMAKEGKTEAPVLRSAEEVQKQFGVAFPVLAGSVGGRLNPSEIRDALTGEQIRQG